MAAPAEITLKDHSGNWVLNRTLSDDTDAVLKLQGIGWLTRQAIRWATITLHVKQYIQPGTNTTNIDIDQTATGGVQGTREERVLDWGARNHTDHVFGELEGRSRWTGEGADGWNELDSSLKEGWLVGDEEKAGPNGELHVQSWVMNEKAGWTAEQVWGFVEIEGLRYYARRVVVIKGAETMRIRMVYDWRGKE